MVTTNSDSTFIQVKSDNTKNIYRALMASMSVTATKPESRIGEEVKKLGNLLPKVVDETLKQVFKEDGAKIIYDYIENKCHLKREEIAEKPEVFSVDLERLLGSGAQVIEELILKNLYSRLQLEYKEKEGYGFSDNIKELRKRCGC